MKPSPEIRSSHLPQFTQLQDIGAVLDLINNYSSPDIHTTTLCKKGRLQPPIDVIAGWINREITVKNVTKIPRQHFEV